MDYSQITDEIENFIEFKKSEPHSLEADVLAKDIKSKIIFADIKEGKEKVYPGSLVLIDEKIRAFVLDKKGPRVKLQTKRNIEKLKEKITLDVNPMNVILREVERIKERIKNGKTDSKEKKILDFLTGEGKPAYSRVKYRSEKMNESQRLSVAKSLGAKDFHLIIGPPGTGKTFVIVEIIKNLCAPEKVGESANIKLLITAGTNVAVDNIVKKLIKDFFDPLKSERSAILRIGPINEMAEEVRKYSLQEKMKEHYLWKDIEKTSEEIEELENNILKISDKKYNLQEEINDLKDLREWTNETEKVNMKMHLKIKTRKALQGKMEDIIGELKEKRAVLFELKKQAAHELIEESRIVACTVASCANPFLEEKFDCMIMGEAGQVSTFISLLAILKSDKFILVGDDRQLQPIPEDKLDKLNQSIFNRLFYNYPFSNTFLDTQYRMNKEIADIASELFYKGGLKTFDGISEQRLDIDLDVIRQRILKPEDAVTFIDTCSMGWLEGESEKSRFNKKEAKFVCDIVSWLLNAGIEPEQIGLITPYKKQVYEIKRVLKEKNNIGTSGKVVDGADIKNFSSFGEIGEAGNRNTREIPDKSEGLNRVNNKNFSSFCEIGKAGNIIEVETIHRFQGREKDIIILSLVRSLGEASSKDVYWFDKEKAKLNVAITRPKKKLIVVGNSRTLSKSFILKKFFKEIGEDNRVVL